MSKLNNHVIVISHRRSGTHLTIDSIINNFEKYGNESYWDIDRLQTKHRLNVCLDDVKKELDNRTRVIKTHCLPDFSIYTQNKEEEIYYQELFASAKKIYIYRNCLDVMVSLYYYMRRFDKVTQESDFSTFLKKNNNFDNTSTSYSRSSFWAHHFTSWQNSPFGKDILFLKFEDWVKDYEGSLNKISHHLGLPMPTTINDLRMKDDIKSPMLKRVKKFGQKIGIIKGIKRTSIFPRKGKVGGHRVHFDKKNTLPLIQDDAKALMRKLGYSENI